MPLSYAAELAQRLYVITLELEQNSQNPESLRSSLQARAEILEELSKCKLDPKSRQILERVQAAEATAIASFQDWRGAIVAEADQSKRRLTAVKAYSHAA